MRFSDAARAVGERTLAVAGIASDADDDPGFIPYRGDGDPVRLLLSGLDLGEDTEAVVGAMGAAAQNALCTMAVSHPAYVDQALRAVLAQVFLTGHLMGRPE
jgi:hypothetical protein